MIKEQDLLEYGFTKIDDYIAGPFEKHLSLPDEDGGRLTLMLTFERNNAEFALQLPDGSKLFLQVDNLNQLKAFERSIQSWEPIY